MQKLGLVIHGTGLGEEFGIDLVSELRIRNWPGLLVYQSKQENSVVVITESVFQDAHRMELLLQEELFEIACFIAHSVEGLRVEVLKPLTT